MELHPSTENLHSAEYFGDYRDYWWNRDFLELMARRLNFTHIGNVLDVGCGVGHWGQTLSTLLPLHAHFTGVDREEQWITQATQRSVNLGLGSRSSYVQGDLHHLPFPDNAFDLVTCQTVLIHIQDTKKALTEMLRVLKPGGLLLAVEPNNLAQHTVMSNLSKNVTSEDLIDLFRLSLICQRGKEALGLGNISLGDLLPGHFSEVGVKDIQVHISDKAVPLFPPYESKEQKVHLKQSLEWNDREFWIWSKDETWRYFSSGGGSLEEFNRLWKLATHDDGSFKKSLAENTYHTAGGSLVYLVSGRKPSTQVSN